MHVMVAVLCVAALASSAFAEPPRQERLEGAQRTAEATLLINNVRYLADDSQQFDLVFQGHNVPGLQLTLDIPVDGTVNPNDIKVSWALEETYLRGAQPELTNEGVILRFIVAENAKPHVGLRHNQLLATVEVPASVRVSESRLVDEGTMAADLERNEIPVRVMIAN
jgi:hypothetical protein